MKLSKATHTSRARIIGATIYQHHICFVRSCQQYFISRYYAATPANLARAEAANIKDHRPTRHFVSPWLHKEDRPHEKK